jgi:hypothetical protein
MHAFVAVHHTHHPIESSRFRCPYRLKTLLRLAIYIYILKYQISDPLPRIIARCVVSDVLHFRIETKAATEAHVPIGPKSIQEIAQISLSYMAP